MGRTSIAINMVLSLDRWRGKVAIVTGASSGIGAALVQRLVEEGLQVVGLARRVERVEELSKKLAGKKGKLHPIKTDVSQPEDVIKAFKWVKENLGSVHILVNNAAVIKSTNLIDGDIEMWKQVLDTNVLGLCVGTREAVASMKSNKIDGHIVHINSIGGHIVPNLPGVNVYAGSKHAVTALTETLRQEFNRAGLKIKITSVSPGGVDTEMVQSNKFKLTEEMLEALNGFPMLQSEDVVDSIIYVLSTPPHVQVHELLIKPIGEVV